MNTATLQNVQVQPRLRPTSVTIQLLRFLAASAVVLSHFFQDVIPLPGNSPEFRVGLFFVISGYVMVLSTERSKNPLDFMKKRVARLVPLYWSLTILAAFAAIALPTFFRSTHANLIEVIKSLFFIPFKKESGLFQPILFVGWTLNYEFFFYGVFAIAMAVSYRYRGLIASVMLGILVIVGIIGRFSPSLASFYTDPIMTFFLFGMILRPLHLRVQPTLDNIVNRRRELAIGLRLVALILAVQGLGSPLQFLYVLLPLVFVCAIVAEDLLPIAKPELPIKLGDISYGIYLLHPFVTSPINRMALRMGIKNPVILVALFFVAYGIVLVLSTLSYKWFEGPAQAWILGRRTLAKAAV